MYYTDEIRIHCCQYLRYTKERLNEEIWDFVPHTYLWF